MDVTGYRRRIAFYGFRAAWMLLLAALIISPLLANTAAGGQIDRRVKVGLKLFPAVLSADTDLRTKQSPGGTLNILVVYERSRVSAQEIKNSLSAIDKIKSMAVHVETVSLDDLEAAMHEAVAGVFIADPNITQLGHVISLAKAHRVIVFSPFEGDVERGVLSGISVSDRILPYVNLRALGDSGIRLKSFFMKIAVSYE